jgi:hypothetical protein
MIVCTAVQVAAVAPSDASVRASELASLLASVVASGDDASGTLESGVGAVVVVVLVGLGVVVVLVLVGDVPASSSTVTSSLEQAA